MFVKWTCPKEFCQHENVVNLNLEKRIGTNEPCGRCGTMSTINFQVVVNTTATLVAGAEQQMVNDDKTARKIIEMRPIPAPKKDQ